MLTHAFIAMTDVSVWQTQYDDEYIKRHVNNIIKCSGSLRSQDHDRLIKIEK